MTFRTRFAPSPNGRLHIGHGYAALIGHDLARKHNGQFQLRIEDIDAGRSRPEFIRAIIEDLRWLGLTWDGEIVFQSARLADYQHGFARLRKMELVYPCFCSRKDIEAALVAKPMPLGPDGPIYPGSCRQLDQGQRDKWLRSRAFSWRLDMARALDMAQAKSGEIGWHDLNHGAQNTRPTDFGDIILVRKDAPASYHLASVIDDARDRMSHIVRGHDLFRSSDVHRLLQILLDLPEPLYVHHGLLVDRAGEKLAQSKQAMALGRWRETGISGNEFARNLRDEKFPTWYFFATQPIMSI